MATKSKIIDTHSHILPGIDDGAKTLSDSIDLINELVEQGVTDIIATPHFVSETNYTSTRANNSKLLSQLKKELLAENIKVNLYLGNEIFIEPDIAGLIKKRKVSTMADSRYLLIELPLDSDYPNYEDYFSELIEKGYFVILAHPERYSILQKDFGAAKSLREIGVLFQCNYGSIIGKYGKEAKKLVKKFAKDKMIFVFGSDIHHARGKYYVEKAIKKLSKYYKPAELRTILSINPNKLLAK
ncbi:hypothetical protein IKG41_02485 [Candidatus Saccharibacteria bacterium]|nr:hypothetical protein [Candidatus Saccharibacteria bacterium]